MENDLQKNIKNYLDYCRYQKRLDEKTLKAYRIDLGQFTVQVAPIAPKSLDLNPDHSPITEITETENADIVDATDPTEITDVTDITPLVLENYIAYLHQTYKPKTVKRKIASLKALFHFLEYKEVIERNPFSKLQIKFREPSILPKTIPLHTVEQFLSAIYSQYRNAKTDYQKKTALRDAAVIELLFSTGMRISELCALKSGDVNLYDRTILIYGKGAKERRIQIGNDDVIRILETYREQFRSEIQGCGYFFINLSGRPLTDQSVRRMIHKYCALASIELHITPHMFRHTFATSLLEADVDIRYIQEMLGHSSINITEIYTHVATAKQRDILTTKHPRKDFKL
ncbi:MAG: tyrosine-type recombinase/integrase [Lachnospiraceae bacterium]|nr:tyrosine-type recombinase/integrase [Lachnospiraceae bacterium]